MRAGIADGALRGLRLDSALKAGKMRMDLLRTQVAALLRGPAAARAADSREISGLVVGIEMLTIGGLAAGLLAGLAGIALFTAGISRRVAAAAANAGRLGAGQPLVTPPPSADDSADCSMNCSPPTGCWPPTALAATSPNPSTSPNSTSS